MKENLLKASMAFLLSLGIAVFLYWPIYQKIPLDNLKQENQNNIDIKINRDFPLGERIEGMVSRTFGVPLDSRHELCLKNRNKFYFFHSDSRTPEVPFDFYTNDLNQQEYGRKNKLGAMAISLYFQNGFEKDEIYREFGQPIKCIKLEIDKLENYASSTIEYSFVFINRLQGFDIQKQEKLIMSRPIIKGYFIDTTDSWAFIIARWDYFVLTVGLLFSIFGFKYLKKILFLIKQKIVTFLKENFRGKLWFKKHQK